MPSEHHERILQEMHSALAGLRERSQLRGFATLAGVNFCSNDYLGLAEDPRLKEAVLESVEDAARVGSTGSRLLSGHDPVWNELEEEFASFSGTEAALYFANGYAANLGLLSSVIGRRDLVFSDELNHASLIDGIRLSGARKVIYPHLDLNALELALRANETESCRKLIVTESVFSMDGDVADVKAIEELAERFGASLIVDEAHATAVHGPGGAGIVAEAGLTREVLATVHTCGKALASAGAFVCGARVLREFLINHARTLIFSTAMPAHFAGQLRAALNLAKQMNRERESLLENSRALAESMRTDGWDLSATASQIIPVIVGSNDDALAAAQFLREQGFAIRAIRPPTVSVGRARLRLSLTARIPLNELQRLRECLKVWGTSRLPLARAGVSAGRA
jgi:8-amino-7-oxononanoate synthase